jgi:pimeloyl-ACP methyl ester carboxylesterase
MAGEMQLTVRTPDRRDLEVLVGGPPDGLPVVFHSGTPAGPVAFDDHTDAAAANGLRYVTYARPGYGRSTAQHGRCVGDAAADVAAIVDRLGAGTFVTAGHSGGGPHALACAALLPDRCLAAASIAGVAPRDADGLDWLTGMGPENVEEFTLAARGEVALTPWLEEQAVGLRAVDPSDLAAELGGLLPPIDQEVLTGEVAELIASECHRALEAGVAGWRDDDLAFTRDWGVDLAAIRVPVSVWQGGQDLMVPFAHGEWLAAHIPGATAHLFAEHGHISLAVAHVPAVFAELAAQARAGGP